jgi:hypothetical protein
MLLYSPQFRINLFRIPDVDPLFSPQIFWYPTWPFLRKEKNHPLFRTWADNFSYSYVRYEIILYRTVDQLEKTDQSDWNNWWWLIKHVTRQPGQWDLVQTAHRGSKNKAARGRPERAAKSWPPWDKAEFFLGEGRGLLERNTSQHQACTDGPNIQDSIRKTKGRDVSKLSSVNHPVAIEIVHSPGIKNRGWWQPGCSLSGPTGWPWRTSGQVNSSKSVGPHAERRYPYVTPESTDYVPYGSLLVLCYV